MLTKPEHKTNILPLRWFANLCNHLASPFLCRALHHSDHDDYGWKNFFNSYMYKLINKPYEKWGTTYLVISWDLEEDIDKDDF
jgi:hypothetical protein